MRESERERERGREREREREREQPVKIVCQCGGFNIHFMHHIKRLRHKCENVTKRMENGEVDRCRITVLLSIQGTDTR